MSQAVLPQAPTETQTPPAPPAEATSQPLAPQPRNVELAHAESTPDPEQQATEQTLALSGKIFQWTVKAIGIGLTIQGVMGTIKSIQFIFVELPALQTASRLGEITQNDLNTIMAGAVISAISTMISIFFGLKLTVLKTKAASYISLAISIFFFIANTGMTKVVTSFHLGEVLAKFIANLL